MRRRGKRLQLISKVMRLGADRKGKAGVRRAPLALGAALIVVALIMCSGCFPALFDNQTGFGVGTSGRLVSCDQNYNNSVNVPGTRLDDLNEEQWGNAAIIVDVGSQKQVPKWGWVIAIATAMQESKLHNTPHLGKKNDHDSLGLFQQRPSQGWGTEVQIMDPHYSSIKFYERLIKVEGWEKKALTDAAQEVQRSAFPNAYRKWEQLAIDIVNDITKRDHKEETEIGGNPLCAVPGVISASGWVVPAVGVVGSGFRTPKRPKHDGVDIMLPRETAVRAASDGIVITSMCNASTGNCDVDGSPAVKGCGWYVEVRHVSGKTKTRYCHFRKRPDVEVGQTVTAGQKIGEVGSSGNSSGPHLHFEVHVDGKAIDPETFMISHGAPLRQQH